MRHPNTNVTGSVLIWTVLVITILSLVAAGLLQVVSGKYHSTLHTATWQEALVAGESGVDLAVLELRKSLYPVNDAWNTTRGWTNDGGFGHHGLSTIPNAGMAGTEMKIKVNVDGPPELLDLTNNWQYYRIRAIGTMPITGPGRAADNKQDTRLRKVSLRTERFAGTDLAPDAFTGAQVSRRIEAIVRPVSAFDQAIMSVGSLDLSNEDIIIDSYDSRDPLKSTNGLYDPAKQQRRGNIATDGAVLQAGHASVFGDVATNSGVASNIENITGIERTDFYQDPIPVGVPNSQWFPAPAPITINNTQSLAASPVEGSSASRYVVNSIHFAGNEILTFTGNADGSPSYIEIYITGDVSVQGNGQVIVAPGVKAKVYFAGDFDISGNGVLNVNNQPGDLLFYGINPPDPSTVKTFNLGGNSLLSAAVYAPAFDMQINNGGTQGSVFGSFVGKTVRMVGVSDLHYDEALGSYGVINNYKLVSWFEDTR